MSRPGETAPAPRACLIAAPSSGAGKTTVTIGLLAALRGQAVRSVKLGPDYIDPAFHAAATGRPCPNLDAWAMAPDLQAAQLAGDGPLVVEAAMGLHDGAGLAGTGSPAEVARTFGIPVVLVVDAARASHSVAALVEGLVRFEGGVPFRGAILNRVGSVRHEAMLRAAMARAGLPVLGALPRAPDLAHPSRHLGLVQAQERPDLEAWIARLGRLMADHVDTEACLAPWTPPRPSPEAGGRAAPPAQRIAVAQDAAFAFAYPHLLGAWRAAGAEIAPFSPLADEAVPEADLCLLPGGYPELHAGRIAGAGRFLASLRGFDGDIHGECGGYMVLGDGLVDAEGRRHAMAGLLRLETSFAARARHLGYRRLRGLGGPFAGEWRGHEHHHSTTLRAEGPPLYRAWDADGAPLSPMGLRAGRVTGSFAHVIAPGPPEEG
ncbi:MAG: cobyrinate a,c-diamide synthase [Shimia sp.]